ncbi:MAG: hypothetical protein RLZZ500_1592 [Bacteroidota bacterium]|jgi:peptidoglycan/LPS O-acetylase OafA/YrhL
MGKKLEKLEAIRGFAALYVVFHHLFASGLIIGGINFSFLFRFGQEAVILFFILSGFVISYSFEKAKDKSFRLFFTKRFTRIYIPLLIVFAVHYLVLSYENASWIHLQWEHIVGNLCMLQDNFHTKPNVIIGPFLDNDPLWSLSYEWWFYMIYYVLYRFQPIVRNYIVYFLGIAAAISYCFYPNFLNREFMYLVIWWVGVEMSVVYLNQNSLTFYHLRSIGLVLIVLIGILTLPIIKQWSILKMDWTVLMGKHPILEWRHFLFTLVIICAALLWKKMNWIGFKYTFAPFQSVASISFVLYISHYFLITQAHYLDGFGLPYGIQLVLYFGICLLFSCVLERKIYPAIHKIVMKKCFSTQ